MGMDREKGHSIHGADVMWMLVNGERLGPMPSAEARECCERLRAQLRAAGIDEARTRAAVVALSEPPD